MTNGEFADFNDRLLGSGEQLSAYIDEVDSKWADGLSDSSLDAHDFSIAMGKKLADRIGDGVIPMGFVLATTLLQYDCQTGVDGFTSERMPSSLTGRPPVMYDMFTIRADRLARGAFGDEFADTVRVIRESLQ